MAETCFRIIVSKILMSFALLYLLWLATQCPCKRLLCCHLPQFWTAFAFIFAVVVFENGGIKWSDASCIPSK